MSTQRTVTEADQTFWHIAARQFGTANPAIRIAQLSDRIDPWIWGVSTVTIPDDAGVDTGGLPAPGTQP